MSENSYTLHYMGMSDQLHSPAALTPREMFPITNWSEDGWKLESVRTIVKRDSLTPATHTSKVPQLSIS